MSWIYFNEAIKEILNNDWFLKKLCLFIILLEILCLIFIPGGV